MIKVEEITDIVKSVDTVVKFLTEVSKAETDIKNSLKKCENRQQDILHEIEFSRLSRREYNLISKELKEVRIERRNAKNLIELLEPFTQTPKYVASDLTRVANAIRLVKEEQDTRTYEVKDDKVPRKITAKDHFEIVPGNNTKKFKVRKRR